MDERYADKWRSLQIQANLFWTQPQHITRPRLYVTVDMQEHAWQNQGQF
jgi:hypothetical protein